jgi:hypothetical protein
MCMDIWRVGLNILKDVSYQMSSPKFRFPGFKSAESRSPESRNPESWNPEIKTRDLTFDMRHLSEMFQSTFHISMHILPTPEPRNCGLPGLGVRGSRNSELGKFGEINKIWFTIELIGKHIDLPMFEIYFCLHILSSEFRVPDLRTLKPETRQSTILGFGGW